MSEAKEEKRESEMDCFKALDNYNAHWASSESNLTFEAFCSARVEDYIYYLQSATSKGQRETSLPCLCATGWKGNPPFSKGYHTDIAFCDVLRLMKSALERRGYTVVESVTDSYRVSLDVTW